ncbi:MAG: hypothetical protein DWQ02_22550 [Bacteroidetes bacterium]|nr:MAG: hypothetical protein DWQ02_22550 [Bacteroidota bacterium]
MQTDELRNILTLWIIFFLFWKFQTPAKEIQTFPTGVRTFTFYILNSAVYILSFTEKRVYLFFK